MRSSQLGMLMASLAMSTINMQHMAFPSTTRKPEGRVVHSASKGTYKRPDNHAKTLRRATEVKRNKKKQRTHGRFRPTRAEKQAYVASLPQLPVEFMEALKSSQRK
jgi:hypothetical protein